MSSFGFGPSKKGRTADASMMTRNVRIVAQGKADATYADNQKKNPFRLSTAILNGYQYGGETIADTNNGVLPASPAQVEDSEPETFPSTYDLFSPFSVSDWRLNNGYSSESTNPVGITMMTTGPFAPNSGSPRSSSFYTKYLLDLTKSFTLITTFLTRNTIGGAGSPPLDAFAVALSADPRRFGGNGGNVGLFGASTPTDLSTSYPVVAVRFLMLAGTTSLSTADTYGTAPSGNAVPIPGIANKLTTQNNLTVNVTVTYNATTNTLSWIIDDGITTPVSNSYTNVNLPTLLGVNNGYVGVGAGAGAKIQPFFLTGMTYTQ